MKARIVLSSNPETALGPLFDHFNVERLNWPALALAMAIKHKYVVFYENQPIRSRKWTPRKLGSLWMASEVVRMNNPGIKTVAVCKKLAGQKPWRCKFGSHTLRGRLIEARKLDWIKCMATIVGASKCRGEALAILELGIQQTRRR